MGVRARVGVTAEDGNISSGSSRSGRVCGSIPTAVHGVARTLVGAACDHADKRIASSPPGRRVGTALPRPSPPRPPSSPPNPHPSTRETAITIAAKRTRWCRGLRSCAPYGRGGASDCLLLLSMSMDAASYRVPLTIIETHACSCCTALGIALECLDVLVRRRARAAAQLLSAAPAVSTSASS